MSIFKMMYKADLDFYPLLFNPNLHTIVWGGDKLTRWKGLPVANHIGESWEVSAIESSPSVIANGKWSGQRLNDVIASMPEQILGHKVAQHYGNKLPLLVKFIDAHSDLSVQVHPNDDMAGREHGKMGKTEMWYVLDAEPGGCLYSGFKEQLTPDEYRQRVVDGTIIKALSRHEVHTDDVFFIPAGRVHAICSGVLLAEVQQSSDVTYRIYDYGRLGLDGKPRELHTELAARALDFHVENKYKTDFTIEGNRANRVIESPFFSVRVTELEETFHRNLVKYDSFIISMCLKGDCKIKVRSNGSEIILREGYSCLIPAAIADYDITPLNNMTRILDAFIDNKDRSLLRRMTRFLHITKM